MSLNEYHRRMAIANRRAMYLCELYSRTTDPVRKAAINNEIGAELNAAPSVRDVTHR